MLNLSNGYVKIIAAFIIMSFVSIAVGNIFLGILTLCFFIEIYRKQVKFNCAYKGYFIAIGLFVITMLISAVFSGDIAYGLKRWADMWIWRFMPFIVVIFLLNNCINGDLLITMGAGDVVKIGENLLGK